MRQKYLPETFLKFFSILWNFRAKFYNDFRYPIRT